MHSGHKTMTGFLAVLTALLIMISGLVTRWPLWAWAAAFGLLIAGTTVMLVRVRMQQPLIPPERRLEPEAPVLALERWECMVKHVALPSRSEDYDFQFTAVVRWVPQDAPHDAPAVNAEGLAVDAVLDRARRISQQESPQRSSLAQHRLSGELATMQPDSSGRVMAMAERVQLTLADPDRERLQKLATVRKDEAVWEHERKWEQSKRAYLGDDVLKTPGSAVVWWLSKNEEQVDRTVSDIGLLAELSSAANDRAVPENFHRFVPDLAAPEPPFTFDEEAPGPSAPRTPGEYAEFLIRDSGLDDDDIRRTLFIERMAKAADGAGLAEVRDALRRRLDDLSTPSDDYPESPEPPPSANDPFDDD